MTMPTVEQTTKTKDRGKQKIPPAPATVATQPTPTAPFKVVRASCKLAFEPWRVAEDLPAHRNGECGKAKGCAGCRLYDELYTMRRLAVTAANIATRVLWKADSAALDVFYAEHGRMPKGAEWPLPDLDVYSVIRKAAPELGSGIASHIARSVQTKWAQERWNALVKQVRSPPHYRTESYPLTIRAQEVRVREVDRQRGQYELSFQMRAKQDDDSPGDARWRVPIFARDGRQREQMHQLALGSALEHERKQHPDLILGTGGWRVGTAHLQQDQKRKGRWYLRIAYTRLVQPVARTLKVAAINRGIGCFFAAVTSEGEQLIDEGADIIHGLKQFQDRRRQFQRQYKLSMRTGHGKTRALKPIEALRAAGERWRSTLNQTKAARLAQWLNERNVSHVYWSNFTGIRDSGTFVDENDYLYRLLQEWPYFDFGTRGQSRLAELGIGSSNEDAHGISQTCPECGHKDPANLDYKNRLFVCGGCAFKRHMDVSAGMNLIKVGEARHAGGAKKKPPAGKKVNGAAHKNGKGKAGR